MKTKIRVQELYTTEDTALNYKDLYVFGDNCIRSSYGGQAIIRDLPNSFGVATKFLPSTTPESYFRDGEFLHTQTMVNDLAILEEIYYLGLYDNIVFPSAGLGTGLAKLPEVAPGTFSLLCDLLLEFGFVNSTGQLVSVSTQPTPSSVS